MSQSYIQKSERGEIITLITSTIGVNKIGGNWSGLCVRNCEAEQENQASALLSYTSRGPGNAAIETVDFNELKASIYGLL